MRASAIAAFFLRTLLVPSPAIASATWRRPRAAALLLAAAAVGALVVAVLTFWPQADGGPAPRTAGSGRATVSPLGPLAKGTESRASAAAESLPAHPELDALVSRLVDELMTASPGAAVGIAILLPDGTMTGFDADRLFVSASTAKVYWVVAAVAMVGVEPVANYAQAIFGWSDDHAAGYVIDLVGVEAINTFLAETAGLGNTMLIDWSTDVQRSSSEWPGVLAGNNYTTARDAVTFLSKLMEGQLLPAEATAVVLEWLTRTPRSHHESREGGLLADRFPAEVQAAVMHKAGYLQPQCCDDIDNLIADIGIVPLPEGSWYAIAIYVVDGSDYAAEEDFIAVASCRVYVAITDDGELDCSQVPDPPPMAPTAPEPTGEPPGAPVADASQAPTGAEATPTPAP